MNKPNCCEKCVGLSSDHKCFGPAPDCHVDHPRNAPRKERWEEERETLRTLLFKLRHPYRGEREVEEILSRIQSLLTIATAEARKEEREKIIRYIEDGMSLRHAEGYSSLLESARCGVEE